MTTEETKEIISNFCDQCVWLKTTYNQYRILYESGKKDRMNLLKEAAGGFFRDLEVILVEYIFLNICKLTDPANKGNNKNLTIKYVLERIDSNIQKKLGLDRLSEKIHKFRERIVPARNKIIAHQDIDTVISNTTLSKVTESKFEQFWIDLQEFVNSIYNHYFNEPFSLDIVRTCDAEDLIWALKKAAYFNQHFTDVIHVNLLEDHQFRYRNA
jgi:hypothetical protein